MVCTMFCCDWLVFNSCDWCISILAVLVNCPFGGPLLYDSPVIVFLDRGHPCFWTFYSTVPVNVGRVKSYVNRLFDPETQQQENRTTGDRRGNKSPKQRGSKCANHSC